MMTPSAIYFHVPNKQTLLLAVYEEGVQRIVDRVDRAVAGGETAWSRLPPRSKLTSRRSLM
jgi:TetR/AcrR family transcriptional regulator, cholesterol catabolism regulator